MKQAQYGELGIDELVEIYKNAASAHRRASDVGDFRKGNKEFDVVAAVYRELRKRGESAQRALLPLLEDEDLGVKVSVAARAMEFAPELGQPILEMLSRERGTVGLNASMVLKVWREGTLRFP